MSEEKNSFLERKKRKFAINLSDTEIKEMYE